MKKFALGMLILIILAVVGKLYDSNQMLPPIERSKSVEKKPTNSSQPTPPHYIHQLSYDPEKAILLGKTRISVWNRATKPTKQVWLELYIHGFDQGQKPPVLLKFMERAFPKGVQHGNMEISQLTVDGEQVASQREGSILKIDLKKGWNPQKQLEMELEWEVKIPEIAHRFGRDQHAAWFGNVLPVLAVYDNEWHGNQYEAVGDPFFNETADFTVDITTPRNIVVISTGDESEIVSGESKVTKINAKHVRDFTFAISRDHQVETSKTSSGKTVNLYYRKAERKQVLSNLKQAVAMLEYMEKRVGPYPYQELDIFENEMFVTGMEYPGIVFVRSDRLNQDTGYQSVVHEIAHQWFYNLVGNNQLEEPWLDEGFATYFQDEFVYGNRLNEYYKGEQQAITERFPQTRIASVYQYQDWSSYWRGNYRQASLMIFALRQKLGEEKFQMLLHEYLKEFQYKIVTGNDFVAFAQNFAKDDLTPFFKEWGLEY